jgi:hypothetical protein
MIDERELLEHAMRRFEPEPGFTDRIYHRRDRKRRNQRIAAGVVGIAVFVAAVWAVTSVSSMDRSEEVVVPAVSGTTGPTKTEPTKTEPTGPEEEPITTQASPNPDDVWRKDSLGAGRDEVVAYYVDHYVPFVYVYADGRVLSATRSAPYVKERRLTPEGVDLVQSGAVGPYSFIGEGPDLPEGAWADDASKRYVPSRYSVCFQNRGKPGNRGDGGFENPSTVLRFFPASAQAILGEVTILQDNPYASGGDTRRCSVVSPEEKHALHRIMGEPGRHVTVTDSEGNKIMWWIRALLPHGEQVRCLPCF